MTNSKKLNNSSEIGIVYLIHQCSGEYEDSIDIVVGVFDNLKKAEEMKQKLKQKESELVSKYYKNMVEAYESSYHIWSIEKNKIDMEKLVE